jgi:hypothetical protein
MLLMMLLIVIIKRNLAQFGYALVCTIIEQTVEHTQRKHATGKCNTHKDGRKITNIHKCNLN